MFRTVFLQRPIIRAGKGGRGRENAWISADRVGRWIWPWYPLCWSCPYGYALSRSSGFLVYIGNENRRCVTALTALCHWLSYIVTGWFQSSYLYRSEWFLVGFNSGRGKSSHQKQHRLPAVSDLERFSKCFEDTCDLWTNAPQISKRLRQRVAIGRLSCVLLTPLV